MAANSEGMKGPRLEFVVRPLKGNFMRPKHRVVKKKIETHFEKELAGYVVYMPNGTSQHLTHKQLLQHGFDRQPSIINFETVNDTKTPAGKYKFAMDDKQRKAAWALMEQQVIKACQRRHGPVKVGDEENELSSSE